MRFLKSFGVATMWLYAVIALVAVLLTARILGHR